jgi:thiol-disulfide isomerase/thioredoxin
MTSNLLRLAVAVCALAQVPNAHAFLKVGDQAPAFGSLEWVKGSAVSFPKDFGNKVYIVEFWATWCMPCKISIPLLNDLQQQNKGNLTIVSITSPDPNNTLPMVQQFVEQQGNGMDYTIAFDRSGTTHAAYMEAAGQLGIPFAFLVGQDGRIAWQGSPLQPEMTYVLERLISGTFDLEVHKKVSAKLGELTFPMRMGDHERVVTVLKEILELDPANEAVFAQLIVSYVQNLHDAKGLRDSVKHLMRNHQDNPHVQSALARQLLRIGELTYRLPDLTNEAAAIAYERSKDGAKADAAMTYALARYQLGDVDRAIELQREAVALASSSDRAHFEAVLEYYLKCKEIRDGPLAPGAPAAGTGAR